MSETVQENSETIQENDVKNSLNPVLKKKLCRKHKRKAFD